MSKNQKKAVVAAQGAAPAEAQIESQVSETQASEKKESKSVSSKDKVAFFQPLIQEGKYSAAELLKMAQDHFPKLTESTIRTFITDSKNPKYNKFEKLVVVTAEKKLAFASEESKAA